MKILVLGDCQSNGNNCLADQVLNESLPRTWSLQYHNENFKKIMKWFLEDRVKNNEVEKISIRNIEAEVWKYLQTQERKLAWPALLNGEVTNRSFNGATFVGYHKRLIEYINTVGIPDHVLVTDFTFPHIVSSFKYDNKRYVFEKSPNYGSRQYNPNDYPVEVHLKLADRITFQLSQPREWHIKKHTKSFDQLVKVLTHYNLKWTVFKFGDTKQENIDVFDKIMGDGINCLDLFQQYHYTEGGENSTMKLNLQQTIANRIQSYINKS